MFFKTTIQAHERSAEMNFLWGILQGNRMKSSRDTACRVRPNRHCFVKIAIVSSKPPSFRQNRHRFVKTAIVSSKSPSFRPNRHRFVKTAIISS
jgi:hypothetical protein